MAYRKIIGFGDSSFVVSLPKEWVVKNGLKKGDNIFIAEDEGNSIKITTISAKQNNSLGEIKVNFDGNTRRLKSDILYAYVNNFNPISIIGKDVQNHIDEISKITRNFMYLEIIDQSSLNKVVLNSSIDLNDIPIYDTLRRMDRIIISMAEDVMHYLSGKHNNINTNFYNKEENVNKLCNLVFKTLKLGFNSAHRKTLGLEINDIFYYWEIALFLEKIANQLKRIPRLPGGNMHPELLTIFDKMFSQYQDAMKANFSKDYELAISVVVRKKKFYDDVDMIAAKLNKEGIAVAHRVGIINTFSGNIAMALLRLKMDAK